MTDYKRIKTSAEVWTAIRASHPELVVFGSYSVPSGDWFGNPSKGRMFTSYGFSGCYFPVICAETTWDISCENPYKRDNEITKYWLCTGDGNDD